MAFNFLPTLFFYEAVKIAFRSKPEMHENAAEIFVVFLYPMIELFYLRLSQKTQYMFFQLSAPFAGDNFY